MSDDILEVRGLVGGYGKMTILNGTSFSRCRRGSITTVDRAERRRQIDGVQGDLRPAQAVRERPGHASRARDDHRAATSAQLLAAGICYVPQGRNIFPELSVTPQSSNSAPRRSPDATSADLPRRIEACARAGSRCCKREGERRRRPRCPAASRSSSKSSRGLLLDPQLMLIDEPSIGLSPLMVQQTVRHPEGTARPAGSSILMIEQNARSGAGDVGFRPRARAGP